MTVSDPFTISAVPALKDNYIWLIGRESCKDIVIVDPGEAAPAIQAVTTGGLRPAAILITHHHWDHVNGVTELAARYSIPVFGPARESIPARTHAIEDGDAFVLPGIELPLSAMCVPGHTAGATAYYGAGRVFTGDTLFTAGCGRLFEGTPAQMYQSLNRLAALPEDTSIYCGHEYTLSNLQFAAKVEPQNIDIQARLAETTVLREQGRPTVPATLAIEKRTNPFLRCDLPSVRGAAESRAGRKLTSGSDVLAVIREWKNRS